MEKDLIDIVIKKQFIELSEKDRSELKEWCSSEEEFEQLKSVFKGVERLKAAQTDLPKEETKQALDELFAQKHAKGASTIWYNSILIALYPTDKPLLQRPVMQVAAIGLIMLMVYPFLFKNELDVQKPKMAKVEKQDELKSNQEMKEDASAETKSPIENAVKEQNSPTPAMLEDIPMKSFMEDEIAKDKSADSDAEFAGAATYAWTAAPAVSDHPDGIYVGAQAISYSQSASDQPAVLDLLTATF